MPMNSISVSTPELLCGPFLRRVTKNNAYLWLVTNVETKIDLQLYLPSDETVQIFVEQEQLQVGQSCFVHLIQLTPAKPNWPLGQHLGYDLALGKHKIDLTELSLPGEKRPGFVVNERIHSVIQGSCRKPDHVSRDAFVGLAKQLRNKEFSRPDYLLMAGDQVYVDDVAGPMLVAIQALSEDLGLYGAAHQAGLIPKSKLTWQHSLNNRKSLLPNKTEQTRWQKFWYGEDIISSRYHDNHLIALDEMFACYLLTWSSTCWQRVWPQVEEAGASLTGQARNWYEREMGLLKQFSTDLLDFEFVLANTPTLMIFDDHDVTDDWNLSADWEHHVYNNDTTKHIIRDALLAYSIFQGWGNDANRLAPIMAPLFDLADKGDFACNDLTNTLFEFNHWHYELGSQPNVVVLDTRTHRWRSETSLKKPSGLMDWERLEELEQQLFKANGSILVVSPAPVFGVKSIEVLQKGCDLIGQELLVDVENWMAHQGSAKKLMSMLRHDRAPDEVIILSGDVHYSFCFSAERRFSSSTDKIWQLTCSGFKNEFPQKLLKFFDYIDRVLYSEYSLLNIFTKRRKLAIDHHPLFEPSKPNKKGKQRHLHSQSAAGLVTLTEQGMLQDFSLITADGERLTFVLGEH